MFVSADGEKAFWVTERSQLPSGEWRIMVWLNTTDDKLSNRIHKEVAQLVKAMMEASLLQKGKSDEQ